MVVLQLVPCGEEVVSIAEDGTEEVLQQASAHDAFAATVKKLNLHKRKREVQVKEKESKGAADDVEMEDRAEERKEIEEQRVEDGEEEAETKRKREEKEQEKKSSNPFESVHKELEMACYELHQLNELATMICDQTLFRLEHLQADEKSGQAELTDLLMAFDMKKTALDDASNVLMSGAKMLKTSRKAQQSYLAFIRTVQKRWRMQAISHGNFSSNLRAQEPLAVDCGYYSAGSLGKHAKMRQTRNSARLIVNVNEKEELGDTVLSLDTDKSTFRTIRFAIESVATGAAIASCTLAPPPSTSGAEGSNFQDSDILRQLEILQNSEFCFELFQVLSVEAVQAGELSSGGGFVNDPSGIGSSRSKVAVVENLLDKISVAVDSERLLSISLVPVEDEVVMDEMKHNGSHFQLTEGSTESSKTSLAYQFCRMAGVTAQHHLRNVHKGVFDNSLLSTLVDKYRQMDSLDRISSAIDSLSSGLTRAPDSKAPARLFKLRSSWTHRDSESYVEIFVGSHVLIRCKLVSGNLILGSICLPSWRTKPYEWEVSQQIGDHIFACPNAIGKLKKFLISIILHEFMYSLRQALTFTIGEENANIHMDVSTGTLSWLNSTDSAVKVLTTVHDSGCISVALNGQDITRPSVSEIVTQAMLLTI